MNKLQINPMKMYAILLISILLSCTGTSGENGKKSVNLLTLGEVQQQEEVLKSYFEVKNHLIKTDADAAAKASASLASALKSGKMNAILIKAAEEMANSTDVEVQRKAFKTVTDGLLEYIKADGTSQTVYVQYCPMAFGNKGANWLSDSKEVLNPYFGNKMLRCGMVKEEIKK